MLIGAVAGGLIGGAGLTGTVNYIISGTQGIVSAIIRIVTAGILAGALIESGAAERIAEAIMNKLGAKPLPDRDHARDVGPDRRRRVRRRRVHHGRTDRPSDGEACGLSQDGRSDGAARRGPRGQRHEPNPNDIAAAEGFGVPLTSIIAVGIIPAVVALIVTSLLAYHLRMRGTDDRGQRRQHDRQRTDPASPCGRRSPVRSSPSLSSVLRPIAGITIDPLIALPVGGIVGTIAMGKTREMGHYFTAGLAKMSGVAMLLIGTGALAGIISNSSLKDVIISGIETLGLPAFMLAPIAGMMMGAATASATAGTTLASQIFGPTVVASGIAPLAAAAMTNASVFVFDGLPHGSFFHVSAGGVNMGISERLKLLGYEAINGFAMLAVSTLVFGVFRVLG